MNRVTRNRGFTLVELMLAMVFVSALLVMVAVITIQISNIYNRGLLLKADNEAASKIMDDLQQQISSSGPFALDSKHYVSDTGGGRLCTGSYSYIWNYGKSLSGDGSVENVYEGENSSTLIHFIKVQDSSGSYCSKSTSKIIKNDAVELLGGTDLPLALQDFTITNDASDDLAGQRLYYVSFMLGTYGDGLVNYSTNNLSAPNCKVPSDTNGDLSYCYMNKFEMTARSGGEK